MHFENYTDVEAWKVILNEGIIGILNEPLNL